MEKGFPVRQPGTAQEFSDRSYRKNGFRKAGKRPTEECAWRYDAKALSRSTHPIMALRPHAGIPVIRMPDHAGLLLPFLHTAPLQLLVYHAVLKCCNVVDRPRILAKSVTVE